MIKVGEFAELKITKKVDFGVYLTDGKEDVLLPAKEVPEDAKVGDEIKVFIYKDSSDRLISTTTTPLITKDRPAVLKVKEVSRIGAFLDWGLPKDLLLPYKEMRGRVEADDEILVRLYEDKSHRLCASMKGIFHELSSSGPYTIGDEVNGRVYEFGHDFGTFVAVDDRYSAMIPRHEDVSDVRIGDVIPLRVTGVKEDGKLDVTRRQKAYLQMEDDASVLLDIIDSYAGVLPFTEKASPEVIKRETGLSKAAFKRAVGRLYKQHIITLDGGKIKRKVDDQNEGNS